MSAKQVTNKSVANAQASDSIPQTQQNLFMSVRTYDPQGKPNGERIVDLYHFGTRNWLQNHLWWAMHNSNQVEVDIAKPEEIDEYLAKSREALAQKFNKPQTEVVEVIAA